jgi:c-di-GMP-binding flagellar brake protein YcgR
MFLVDFPGNSYKQVAMTSAQLAEELRSATRIGVRTPVVIYYLNASDNLARTRAWTDDISGTGAKVTLEQPLPVSAFYIRVMLPDLKNRLISCEIVREIRQKSYATHSFHDIRRSYYGLRFVGMAPQDIVEAVEELDNLALGRS